MFAWLPVQEDDEFQALSVTAMDWMQVNEVPVARIEAFLADKKAQGYTVVGLEQAQHSVPLEHCEFPEKVVLVLGNEAKGIPVKLIQQLDICVEIPQVGLCAWSRGVFRNPHSAQHASQGPPPPPHKDSASLRRALGCAMS